MLGRPLTAASQAAGTPAAGTGVRPYGEVIARVALECQEWPDGPMVNAFGRLILGLLREDSHLGQIREIVRQAPAAQG